MHSLQPTISDAPLALPQSSPEILPAATVGALASAAETVEAIGVGARAADGGYAGGGAGRAGPAGAVPGGTVALAAETEGVPRMAGLAATLVAAGGGAGLGALCVAEHTWETEHEHVTTWPLGFCTRDMLLPVVGQH